MCSLGMTGHFRLQQYRAPGREGKAKIEVGGVGSVVAASVSAAMPSVNCHQTLALSAGVWL
jgi:hypothetical protein